MTDQDEYLKLSKEIWRHSRLYYVDHSPEISDQEFDDLYRRLEDMEKVHPEWVSINSPTQRVGEALTDGFQAVTHSTPMLSLGNTYSSDEIQDFIDRCSKNLGRSSEFSVELKMDGIAVSIRYENGLFCRAVTRGDGKQGDDITANIRTIKSLPLQLFGDDVPEVLEVRGEVFMPHKTFTTLNEQREEQGDASWANPRNAAAGSLKLLHPQEVAGRGLELALYSVAVDSSASIKTQSEIHQRLKNWGLPNLLHTAHCTSMNEIMDFAEKVLQLRASLPFDIDGIVIKLDSLREQNVLGLTGKKPRWAVAYKFAAEKALTRIRDITVQVGRTGTLTPVAELEAVSLAGSTIARATLHNEEEIQRKDIRIGDTVWIEKGGDVIPKVLEVDLSQRPSDSIAWKMPEFCPACETPVLRLEGEVAVRCPNTEHCPDQQLRRIVYFSGKQAMDIDHMGEKVVEQLFQKGLIKKASDIFLVSAEQLYQLEGFKEKSVENLLQSIENAKDVSLIRFIMALGIKFVGTGTAELLAYKAGSIDALMKVTEEQLLEIDGIGDKVASSVVEFFSNEKYLSEVHALLRNGVIPGVVEIRGFSDHDFSGKTFVLTGTLTSYTRSAAASLIKERGGKITGSVSKKTDFLLAGDSPGSKFDKAEKLGVKIIEEKEFSTLL
ncbi:MAG: DNA ligase (NAD+) [Chlamydiales bacterium]|jgi:DNA ligase (NAD+)